MRNDQPPNAGDVTRRPGAQTNQRDDRDLTSSTSDTPLAASPRHAAGEFATLWRWPVELEQLARQAVVRHIVNEPDAAVTVRGCERLAESVLCALGPHMAARDRRITELLGVAGRLRDELDGTLERQEVHFERRADAADGAEQAHAW